MNWNDTRQQLYNQYIQSLRDKNNQIYQDCTNWNNQNPNGMFYKQPIYDQPSELGFQEWLKGKI